MTKIMAVTLVPVLVLLALGVQETPRPSQNAKSVAADATSHVIPTGSDTDLQRRRNKLIERADRSYERQIIKERRARAKARAEARAERKAERQAVRQAEREAEAKAATSAATRNTGGGSNGLPQLLLVIRSHESGGNYQAYNGSGCEGYGCYGAYQLHGNYMGAWAAEAGYGKYSSTPATQWPASVQDAVALYKFNQTNGGLWCDWTDYC